MTYVEARKMNWMSLSRVEKTESSGVECGKSGTQMSTQMWLRYDEGPLPEPMMALQQQGHVRATCSFGWGDAQVKGLQNQRGLNFDSKTARI